MNPQTLGAQIDCFWRHERNPFAQRVFKASLVKKEWTSLKVSGVGHCWALQMKLQLRKSWQICTFCN